MSDYFHLSGAMLATGSTIMPGNWGRIIRAFSWRHTLALREMALEQSRVTKFPDRPSRLDAAFAFATLSEANTFRQVNANGFGNHILYRVTMLSPDLPIHITESRLCGPAGNLRENWADAYWLDEAAQPTAVPGLDWQQFTGGTPMREVVTLSALQVEERLS